MVFNSLTFLIFLAVGLLFLSLPVSWRARKTYLLLASYVFYAAWNPPFVILIWISTVADFFLARRMATSDDPRLRRWLLVMSLLVNLGLLGFFKYGEFLLDQFVVLAELFGIQYAPSTMNIVLPVGISFYTFQTLSYTIDVYRRQLAPTPSFLDFALFVTFFPQLVAGPIVRASYFLPQCVAPRRASSAQLSWGMTLLAVGLFEKVILADAILAPVVDQVYGAAHQAGFVAAWVGTIAFSGQIFFDFSGYSLCAIGVAMCLGFSLPDNFRFPYAAIGFSDFWRRWHISLSSWLRDYLYIPLGGNRGSVMRTQINLMLTMLLGGLWHGASWQFVVWGGLHGSYLVVERGLTTIWGDRDWVAWTSVRVALGVLTYLLVCVTWVFFRADSFPAAFALVSTMTTLGGGPLALERLDMFLVALVATGMLATHWALRDSTLEHAAAKIPWPLRATGVALLLVALAAAPGDDRGFIYFQF